MPITESSITLTFPDNKYFRFEDCNGYKGIQNNFKEMDACWYDSTIDTLYVVELKDWSSADLSSNEYSKNRILDLVKKSIDSTCMLLSILLSKPYSVNIQACMPFSITNDTNIKLLSIINCKSSDLPFVSSVNSEYKSRFNSYAKLFNIRTFLVMNKEKAVERFEWIS